MKASLAWLGALLGAGFLASVASANPPCYGSHPQAPDACGPGFYATNPWGGYYGPNYYLRPSGQPYVASPPAPPGSGGRGGGPGGGGGGIGTPNFPTHPFARSPRDYFMLD